LDLVVGQNVSSTCLPASPYPSDCTTLLAILVNGKGRRIDESTNRRIVDPPPCSLSLKIPCPQGSAGSSPASGTTVRESPETRNPSENERRGGSGNGSTNRPTLVAAPGATRFASLGFPAPPRVAEALQGWASRGNRWHDAGPLVELCVTGREADRSTAFLPAWPSRRRRRRRCRRSAWPAQAPAPL
jgi:hypothetical protein